MDANVVRTLNQGPMGPQGPAKVNYCIMNQEAGFEPVCRIYSHKYEDSSDSDTSESTDPKIVDDSDTTESSTDQDPITPTPTENEEETDFDFDNGDSGDMP